jgi:prohibitin 1
MLARSQHLMLVMLLCVDPLQERNAAIIRAEGESEAAKLISDATKLAGAGLVELRRIEAAKDIAETMSKSQNVVYLPSGGNMLLGINPR